MCRGGGRFVNGLREQKSRGPVRGPGPPRDILVLKRYFWSLKIADHGPSWVLSNSTRTFQQVPAALLLKSAL